MTDSIQIGYLLRSSTTGFVAGCAVAQLDSPAFGALVRAPTGGNSSVYGLIHDMQVADDGLIRQLVTSGNIKPEVMQDNRNHRIVPVEISILTVGCRTASRVSHLLPPRPAISLDVIDLCAEKELFEFTSAGRFGYFRHILQSKDLPTGDLLAAHLQQAASANGKFQNEKWLQEAIKELITLLRDDYPTLMSVLGALREILPA